MTRTQAPVKVQKQPAPAPLAKGAVDPSAEAAAKARHNSVTWSHLVTAVRKTVASYGFAPAITQVMEEAQLFGPLKQLPEDLITAEFGRRVGAVAPRLLPGLLRLYEALPVDPLVPLTKWSVDGATASRDAAGKLHHGYEACFEVLGSVSPLGEAQAICCAWELVQLLGFQNATLEVNTIGEGQSRSSYEASLATFLTSRRFDLCDNCSSSLREDPLSVLRCQNLGCQAVCAEAPTALDFLSPVEQKQFSMLLEALDELQLPYQLSPYLVGQSGWTKTAVSITSRGSGAPVRLAEGGHHDDLLHEIGRKSPAFGFYLPLLGIHKAMLAEAVVSPSVPSDVFLVPLGELACKKSLRLFRDLTLAGAHVYDHFGTAGVKNQLKLAEDHHAPVALIVGQKEALDDVVILRDVKSSMQEIISSDKIVSEVMKRLDR